MSKDNFVTSVADFVMTSSSKGYPVHELLTRTYFLCWQHPKSYRQTIVASLVAASCEQAKQPAANACKRDLADVNCMPMTARISLLMLYMYVCLIKQLGSPSNAKL